MYAEAMPVQLRTTEASATWRALITAFSQVEGILAREMEEAGWDGISVWDHILPEDGMETADPWVMLAAAAMVTDRIRLMTLVTPLPRRHPWKLARECVSIDLLSGGRLVLGVGSGALGPELTRFGGEEDLRTRADMLDEGLEILTGREAGALDAEGLYPEGSLNVLIRDRLAELAAQRRGFAQKPGEGDPE